MAVQGFGPRNLGAALHPTPPHTPFICVSTDGHLVCFHIFTTVDNAAVNIGVHVSFIVNVLFSSDKYPGVEELLSHI